MHLSNALRGDQNQKCGVEWTDTFCTFCRVCLLSFAEGGKSERRRPSGFAEDNGLGIGSRRRLHRTIIAEFQEVRPPAAEAR